MRASVEEPQRVLTIVPASLVEREMLFYYAGPKSSHQASKATAAKIARVFFWPAIKQNIKIFILIGTVCAKYLRLGRVLRAGHKLIKVSSRGDCIAMDIVGGQGSLPMSIHVNKYILTIIDCLTRCAIALPLHCQSA